MAAFRGFIRVNKNGIRKKKEKKILNGIKWFIFSVSVLYVSIIFTLTISDNLSVYFLSRLIFYIYWKSIKGFFLHCIHLLTSDD